jgi:hypothetical protein
VIGERRESGVHGVLAGSSWMATNRTVFFHFPVATMDNILKFLGVNSEKMMIWKKPELLYY